MVEARSGVAGVVGAGAAVTAETVIVTPAVGDITETERRTGRSRVMHSSTRCHRELHQLTPDWPDSNSKATQPPMVSHRLLLATTNQCPHQDILLSILPRLKDIISIKAILHPINMAEISQVLYCGCSIYLIY